MTLINHSVPSLDFSTVKTFEHQLDDVMEVNDNAQLRLKLTEVEHQFYEESKEINKTRLGIIYHLTALNSSFLSN